MLGFTSLRRRTEALLPDFEEVKGSWPFRSYAL